MIKLFAMDVDGTLTDGGIYMDGAGGEMKRFDVQDGQGIAQLLRKGVKVVFISGRFSAPTQRRAEDLKITADDDVLYLRRILFTGDEPKMVDLNYIPLKLYPMLYEKIDGDFSLFRILKSEYGAESYQQYKVLKVKAADPQMAEELNVKPGSPLFDMYKVSYVLNGTPMHVSISYIGGENASYVIAGDENNSKFYSGFNWKE